MTRKKKSTAVELSLPIISRKTPAPKPTQKELLDAMVQRAMEENERQIEEATTRFNATKLPVIEALLAHTVTQAKAMQHTIATMKSEGKTDLEIVDYISNAEATESPYGSFNLDINPGWSGRIADVRFDIVKNDIPAAMKAGWERCKKAHAAIPASMQEWSARDKIKKALAAQRNPQRLLEDPAARAAVDQALNVLGIITIKPCLEVSES